MRTHKQLREIINRKLDDSFSAGELEDWVYDLIIELLEDEDYNRWEEEATRAGCL